MLNNVFYYLIPMLFILLTGNFLSSLILDFDAVFFNFTASSLISFCLFNILAALLKSNHVKKLFYVLFLINLIKILPFTSTFYNKFITTQINLFFLEVEILKITEMLWFLVVIYIFGQVCRRLLEIAVEYDKVSEDKKQLLEKFLFVVLVIYGLMYSLSILGLDIKKITLITSGLTIGLGFGLQKIAANFISGIILMVDKKIKINDLVQIDADSVGYVKAIDTKSVLIESFYKEMFIVPNEFFITSKVKNITGFSRAGREKIDFTVPHKVNVQRVIDLTMQAIANVKAVSQNEIEFFNARALNIMENGIVIGLRFIVKEIDHPEHRDRKSVV
jgi:small-conductance mechanosensitive channel